MLPVIAALLLWTAPSYPAVYADDTELAKVQEKLQRETDPEKRIAILKTAIQTRKTSGDVAELGAYNLLLGKEYCQTKKLTDADNAFHEALPSLKLLQPRERMDSLEGMAKDLYQAGGGAYSGPFLISAIEISRAALLLPDTVRLEFLLGNVAPYPAMRDFAHLRAVSDARAVKREDYQALIGEGYAELAYGGFDNQDYRRAIFYFERALEVEAWKEPNMRQTAKRLIVISSGYLGDRRRAQSYGLSLYKEYRDAGRTDDAAMVLNDIATADMESDRNKEAAVGFGKALRETSVGNKNQRATILYNQGMAYQQDNRWKEALAAYQASLSQAKGNDEVRAGNCEASIGMALIALGKPKEALSHLLTAKKLVEKQIDAGYVVVVLETLEKCYRLLGNKKQADATAVYLDQWLSEALGNGEIMRIALGDAAGNKVLDAYLNSLVAAQALRHGRLADAFVLAERAKARSMVDMESRLPIDLKMVTPFEYDGYQWLRARVLKIQNDDSLESPPDRAEEELRIAYEDLNAFDSYLRYVATFRQSGGFRRAQDRQKLDQVTTDLKALPADTVMIQMIRTASTKQDQIVMILAWSEKGKARFASAVLGEKGKPLSGKQIEALCVDYGRACGSSSGLTRGSVVDANEGGFKSGERLKTILIDPIRTRLAKFKRIVISPDDALWRLPLEAVPIGNGKYVIDQWTVDYCYSATQWLQSMRKQVHPDPKYPLLVVANPDYGAAPEASLQTRGARGELLPPLPGTKLEAEKIQSVVTNATAITGPEAQANAVKALMPKYGMLHFATHGLFDPINPLASSLAFSKPTDGRYATELLAQDIQGMSLKAKLAVLSACDTGRGQFRPGDGPIGLTYAFLKAGCPVVVSSRWSVNDQTTALLMADFYRGMAKGQKIGDSLRAAILKTKKTHPQPYYWAPFMLYGDSRK